MASWLIYDSCTTPVEDFDPSWLPLQSARYLKPHIYRGAGGREWVELEAGPYVGALPLTTGDTLYISPRVGRETLGRMVAVTERLQASVRKEFEEFTRLGFGGEDDVSWIQLLGRRFIQQLRLIETNSLRAGRVSVSERRQSVKGDIAIVPTLISLARREANPVHCSYRTKSYDTVEHRVLGAAAGTLLRMGVLTETERPTAARWWARTDYPLTSRDLGTVTRSLASGQYTGPRAYYIPALVMAQLILVQGGLSLDETNTVETEALLTNVYTLFESYVRITLRNGLSEEGFFVEKLESGAPSLFADGTTELIPDVIISDRAGRRLLIDAKYKLDEEIQSSDYYQMAAYLKGFQVQEGIIVRPRLGSGHDPIVKRRMNYGGTIYEMSMHLQEGAPAEGALVAGVIRVLTGGLGALPSPTSPAL